MAELFGMDAYTPGEIAQRIEQLGVAKARLPLRTMFMLAALGGAFIGLGALYSVVVRADHSLGMALRQVLAGLSFALGLLLVVVAGAELFTGNNLLVMPGRTGASPAPSCCATGRSSWLAMQSQPSWPPASSIVSPIST